jgi:superfamily II DNA or RNA helicase
MPLNALPASKAYLFPCEDLPLLDRIETLAGGETPAMLVIGLQDLIELLPLLAGHARVTLGRAESITITKEPWRLGLKATLEANGEIVLTRSQDRVPPVRIGQDWIFQTNRFQRLTLPAACAPLLQGPVRLSRALVPRFLSSDWPSLQALPDTEANFSLEDFALEPVAPRFLLHLAGGLGQLEGQLQCAYGTRIMTIGVTSPEEAWWMPDPASPVRYSTRDGQAEQEAAGRLLRAGFRGPDTQGRYRLQGQDRVLNFVARELPRMQKEWEVTLEERLERSTRLDVERIEPRFEVTASGTQWFDLGVSYETAAGERLAPAEIQRLLLSGQSHTRLRSGKLAVLDTGAVEELQEVLLDCNPQQQEGRYRLAQNQSGFVIGTLGDHGWKLQAPRAWSDRVRRQAGETGLPHPPLGELDGVLRPYQKAGVAWLCFLRENGFGGILADEMGLGKTLQVLALLQSRGGAGPEAAPSSSEPGGGRTKGPTLVVCPTSLVFNWVAEARKFTPGLRVLALQGPERQALFDRISSSDLVVTSYALIRRDLERYREMVFDTLVLDEAQHIKNRQTQNSQAVKSVRCHHRVVLTGTPLENSVLDLWSIFDFLMPGYLGAAREFRERYELPITRDRDAAATRRLARRLRPFILRRLKRDVAKDLPPRLEQVAYCELTPDQRAVYQQIMEAGRKQMLEAAGAETGRSRLAVLTALLRLRQACCDLRLLGLENIPEGSTSGKLDLFDELLEEVVDGGHRVLVFSQFVSLLSLLRQQLEARDLEYCYLDGSTTNRAEVVARFQGSHIPVFLISLKAGGTGLNLTGADTVIHFDPWWNPAVEDQATDRAHRIGQSRLVTSYKLVARDTVEEKILQLQQRKRELTRAALGDDNEFVEALTWEEMQELFAS